MFWLLKAEFIKLKRNKFFYSTIIISLVLVYFLFSNINSQNHIIFWLNFTLLLFFPIWISIISYIVISNDDDKWSILYTYPIRSKYFLSKFICIFLIVLFQLLFILWIFYYYWFNFLELKSILSILNFSLLNLIIFVPVIIFFMIFSQKFKFYGIIYSICTSIIILLCEANEKISNYFWIFTKNWYLFPNYYNTKITNWLLNNLELNFYPFSWYEFSLNKLFINLFSKIDLFNYWIYFSSIIIMITVIILYYKKREIK